MIRSVQSALCLTYYIGDDVVVCFYIRLSFNSTCVVHHIHLDLDLDIKLRIQGFLCFLHEFMVHISQYINCG